MPRSNFCTHHTPSITKVVKGASRGAAGTAGYIAGLLSGVASSDFFVYLKDRTGYKHFFPPVKSDQLLFKDMEIGNSDYEPRAVVKCYLESMGNDYLLSGNTDIDWVLKRTEYTFYPIKLEGCPHSDAKITCILEAAKVLTSRGTSGKEDHLLFMHSLGKCRYVGKIYAGWLEVEVGENPVIRAFSGKGWDGSEGWRDTHVFDHEQGYFVRTERQVRGYYSGGVFKPEIRG